MKSLSSYGVSIPHVLEDNKYGEKEKQKLKAENRYIYSHEASPDARRCTHLEEPGYGFIGIC